MIKRIVFIILALASFISVDAQTLTKEQLLQDYDYKDAELLYLIETK